MKKFLFEARRLLRFGLLKYLFIIAEEVYQIETHLGKKTGKLKKQLVLNKLLIPKIFQSYVWNWVEVEFQKHSKYINKMVMKEDG